MKGQLMGIKAVKSKKDGSPYLMASVLHRDPQSVGGFFADVVWIPGQTSDDLPAYHVGSVYLFDTDLRGRVIGVEPLPENAKL